jgi:hypothetical protein
MQNKYFRFVPIVSSFIVSGCGTTQRFVDEPRMAVSEPSKSVREAAADLFMRTGPYTVSLCEANQTSRECREGNRGITATGVGGLLIPLSLHVTALMIKRENQSADGWDIDASVDSKVDAITPLCLTAHGKVVERANDTISIRLPNFYCNWLAVGNVLVNADLSIDSIDLKDRSFTGFYKITFHGTGNASGSGYYRATIMPAT